MISFLIVLRIAPLPPHWVVNILAPHVGISIPVFWVSTALGILGVSVIHTTIGGGLDQMTSSSDFHLISWRNFFGLSAVVIGVMIPVGLRYWFGRGTVNVDADEGEEEAAEGTALGEEEEEEEEEDEIFAVGPPRETPKPGEEGGRRLLDDDELEDEYDDDDDDLILEAGPAIRLLPKDDGRT
jgi:co-chaperonin GroES (HSP10)